MSMFKAVTAIYSRVLSWLLALSVAVLIVPTL